MLMKPERSAKCHQTLSSWVGSGDETIRSLHVTSCHITTSKYIWWGQYNLSPALHPRIFDCVDMKTSPRSKLVPETLHIPKLSSCTMCSETRPRHTISHTPIIYRFEAFGLFPEAFHVDFFGLQLWREQGVSNGLLCILDFLLCAIVGGHIFQIFLVHILALIRPDWETLRAAWLV